MFFFNRNNKITISLSYYNDAKFLHKQLSSFASYPDNIDIQIIDDGSQIFPIENYLNQIQDKISVYKIIEDIKWNIPGVRNLGAMLSPNPWILHLDMDQIIPLKTIIKISKLKLNPMKYYIFNRKLENKTKFTTGTILLNKKPFWDCGGYDEDFAGIYGHNDPYLKEKLKIIGVKQVRLKNFWINDYQNEASCDLSRSDSEINKSLMKKKLHEKNFFSKCIRFNWKKIK